MVFWCAFRVRAQAALRLSQCLLVLAEETRIGNVLAGAECGKVYQSHVHADYLVDVGQWLGLNFTREAGIPIANSVAADGECFDLALDGPVQLDLDVANLGEAQPSIVEEAEVTLGLRVREAIVSVVAFEARIARFLTACLDPAEEGTERQVDAFLCVLLCLRVTICQPGSFLSPLGEQPVCVVQTEALVLVLPGVAAYFEGLVVHPAAGIQDALQLGTLAFGWIQAVLEGLSHAVIVSYSVLEHKFYKSRLAHSPPS